MFSLNQLVRHAKTGLLGCIEVVSEKHGEAQVLVGDYGYRARWVFENMIPLTDEEVENYYGAL